MNRKLYHLLDLDDTQIHITKKIISTSSQPNSLLLSTLLRRNTDIQDSISNYSRQYSSLNILQFRSLVLKSQEKEVKKKTGEFGVSRGKLEIISNLLKTQKARKTLNNDPVYDKYLRNKKLKREFPTSTLNISSIIQNQEDSKGVRHLPSENSEKENKEKPPFSVKTKPFEFRGENSVLNTIRYSTLVRTINSQKHSTKLPDISLPKKPGTLCGKGVFKRVQFA